MKRPHQTKRSNKKGDRAEIKQQHSKQDKTSISWISDYLKGFISVSDVTSCCDKASLPHRRNLKKEKKKSTSALLSSSSTLPDCLFPSYRVLLGTFWLPQGSSPGSFNPLALTSGSERGFSVCCTSPPAAGSQFLRFKERI